MKREELQKLSSEDFKEFFIKTLAGSRELAKIYNDFIAKSLSVKIKTEKLPRDEAEEILLAVIQYNSQVEAFLERCELPGFEKAPQSSDPAKHLDFQPPVNTTPPPPKPWWKFW